MAVSKDDVLGWLESSRVERNASYAQRGRAHAGLMDDALFDAWKQAMRFITIDPHDPEMRRREEDLVSEIEIRGLAAPYHEVKDAIEAFISCGDQAVTKLEQDDEAYEQVKEEIERDVTEFKERRDRSRH
jgi:hypothetical protein